MVIIYFTRKCAVPIELAQLQITFFPVEIAREVVNVGDERSVNASGTIILKLTSSSGINLIELLIPSLVA